MRALEKKMQEMDACENGMEWVKKHKGTEVLLYSRVQDPSWILWLADKLRVRSLLVNAVLDVLERYIEINKRHIKIVDRKTIQGTIQSMRDGSDGVYEMDYSGSAETLNCRHVLSDLSGFIKWSMDPWWITGRLVCKGLTARSICSILRKRLTYKALKDAERAQRRRHG